jgi:hypothetical protein
VLAAERIATEPKSATHCTRLVSICSQAEVRAPEMVERYGQWCTCVQSLSERP